jgi:hypothetical protein
VHHAPGVPLVFTGGWSGLPPLSRGYDCQLRHIFCIAGSVGLAGDAGLTAADALGLLELGLAVNVIDGVQVYLFSYGTLRQQNVQLAIFGHALNGQPDVLPGFALSPLEITDPGVIATSGTAHHTIVHETGDPLDEVLGTVFRITLDELYAADTYEVDCKRVSVRLQSGIAAFVYVKAVR